MNLGTSFAFYEDDEGEVISFATYCDATVKECTRSHGIVWARFAGDEEAFTMIGSLLYVPTTAISDCLRKDLASYKAATIDADASAAFALETKSEDLMLSQPVDFQSLVDRYDLTILKAGGDLVFDESPKLEKSRGRGIMLGSRTHNAMWVFTSGWRLNAPFMRLMLDTASDLRAHENDLVEAEELALAKFWPPGEPPNKPTAVSFQAARDALGAAALGRGALAASVMIVAAALLGDFKASVEATTDDWSKTSPLRYGAVTAGDLIIAAANSFRHYDEWRLNWSQDKLTTKQLKSINVLKAALGLSSAQGLFDQTNPSEKVSLLLSDEGFDQFEGTVLKFANAVAEKVEERVK